ncbi:hypothetical protein BKA70DRAFT_1419337 [Coprinopsis sp. MPI-PUGE-AT-0042]|nr:hypothetical protein BKA70DRAFT_1419337 [Coprinopsis sp. MPI-PUGE-AT-0042]
MTWNSVGEVAPLAIHLLLRVPRVESLPTLSSYRTLSPLGNNLRLVARRRIEPTYQAWPVPLILVAHLAPPLSTLPPSGSHQHCYSVERVGQPFASTHLRLPDDARDVDAGRSRPHGALYEECYEWDDEHYQEHKEDAPSGSLWDSLRQGPGYKHGRGSGITLPVVGSRLAVQEGDSRRWTSLPVNDDLHKKVGEAAFLVYDLFLEWDKKGTRTQFGFVALLGTIWPLAGGWLSPISATNIKVMFSSAIANTTLVHLFSPSLPRPVPFSTLVHNTNNATFTASVGDTALTFKEHLVAAPGGTGIVGVRSHSGAIGDRDAIKNQVWTGSITRDFGIMRKR